MLSLVSIFVLKIMPILSDVTDCWYPYGTDDRVSAVAVESKVCSDSWCISVGVPWSTDPKLNNATFARIIHDRFSYPRLDECTFYNMNHLRIIDGSESAFTDISVGAFFNLPQLKYLYLPYNNIDLLRSGFAMNVSNLEVLDLSWNKLYHIGSEAFSEMNLKVLNFSRNQLTYFKIEKDLDHLEVLILSHNSLKTLENSKINGAPFLPRMMSIFDLSFNQLETQPQLKCRSGSQCTIKVLDLTKNFLRSFLANRLVRVEIEELRLAYNVLNSNLGNNPIFDGPPWHFPVKRISIYPNPWTCQSGINSSLNTLFSFNITVLPPELDTRFNFDSSYPVCVVNEPEAQQNYRELVSGFILDKGKFCELDKHCPEDMMCRSNSCWNPCKYRGCLSSSEVCTVEEHKMFCKCPEGKLKNPFLYASRCYNVECFEDTDCEEGVQCREHICE